VEEVPIKVKLLVADGRAANSRVAKIGGCEDQVAPDREKLKNDAAADPA
jgi:hypothetical protein